VSKYNYLSAKKYGIYEYAINASEREQLNLAISTGNNYQLAKKIKSSLGSLGKIEGKSTPIWNRA